MPHLIPPVDAGISQFYGANATAGVRSNPNGTTVEQLVHSYGNYQPYGHDGVDYAAVFRSRMVAPGSGVVDFSGDARNMPYHVARKWAFPTYGPDNWPTGLAVCIDHGDGFGSVLAHMDETHVDHLVGRWIEQGQNIGLSGNSGRSGGPHVHHSVVQFNRAYADGRYGRVDPLQFTGHISPAGGTSRRELIRGVRGIYIHA